jgi:hypothetical protein
VPDPLQLAVKVASVTSRIEEVARPVLAFLDRVEGGARR